VLKDKEELVQAAVEVSLVVVEGDISLVKAFLKVLERKQMSDITIGETLTVTEEEEKDFPCDLERDRTTEDQGLDEEKKSQKEALDEATGDPLPTKLLRANKLRKALLKLPRKERKK